MSSFSSAGSPDVADGDRDVVDFTAIIDEPASLSSSLGSSPYSASSSSSSSSSTAGTARGMRQPTGPQLPSDVDQSGSATRMPASGYCVQALPFALPPPFAGMAASAPLMESTVGAIPFRPSGSGLPSVDSGTPFPTYAVAGLSLSAFPSPSPTPGLSLSASPSPSPTPGRLGSLGPRSSSSSSLSDGVAHARARALQ